MDRLFIKEYLEKFYDEVEPKDFYRNIFPAGELEERGRLETGKYNAIAVELLPIEEDSLEQPGKKINARKYIVSDDLAVLDNLLHSDNFIIMSPISYAGRSREAKNARFIYAMAIDLDGITEEKYLKDLIHQIEIDYLPKPTYLVFSGGNLHLYYQFEEAIPCFPNITKQLQQLKTALTKKIWNMYTTTLSNKPQLQSLFQGFRIVGGTTKGGNRTAAYAFGEKITIEYLNEFVDPESQVKEYTYKSSLTLEKAKELYPEWYQRRIIEKQPKGTWQCKKDLYNWWLQKLKAEIKEGHRYYGIMCLAIYAKKSGISREELEADAFSLLEFMDRLTTEESNHFKREDILAALELYNDNYITFPIDSIVELTQINIQKNKRNYRKQVDHLARIRALQQFDYPNGEWRYNKGRKPGSSKLKQVIIEWRKNNKDGTVKECVAATGISQATVYKYWKEEI